MDKQSVSGKKDSITLGLTDEQRKTVHEAFGVDLKTISVQRLQKGLEADTVAWIAT